MFDVSKVSVTITHPTLGVIDGSRGLTIDADFVEVEKENNDKTETRQGTRGVSYTADPSNEDTNRIVSLTYLPNAPIVPILKDLRDQKLSFEILIKNDSDPKYTLTSPECIIIEEPPDKINGKKGFADYQYKIRAVNSQKVFG